jgi:molybdenum cofactor cytidylyltransferase
VRLRVGAVVLAAGASRRLGQPKQLLMHRGETLLARAIRLAVDAGAHPVVVVLGANHELIRIAIEPVNSMVVVNHEWQQGIATSIRCGLDSLMEADPTISGTLILTCDQPRLTSDHLTALIQLFHQQKNPSIAASTYADTVGVPAFFPREVFEQLRALRGDQGARTLLLAPPCSLLTLPLPGGECDIDLPRDLSQLE